MKVLVATDKPFAKVAVDGIRKEIEAAGYELVLLEKYGEKAKLLEAVKDVNAIIIRSDIIDAEVLDAAKELKIVVRAGAGYDNVDLAAATAHNVCVMNTPGQNSNAVAELAFGMMVMAVRNFYNGTSGTELMGKKLGIHAYGNVGRNVARIAKGFGMDIYAFDAFCPKEVIEKDGVKAVSSAEELYAACNIVSLHIPRGLLEFLKVLLAVVDDYILVVDVVAGKQQPHGGGEGETAVAPVGGKPFIAGVGGHLAGQVFRIGEGMQAQAVVADAHLPCREVDVLQGRISFWHERKVTLYQPGRLLRADNLVGGEAAQPDKSAVVHDALELFRGLHELPGGFPVQLLRDDMPAAQRAEVALHTVTLLRRLGQVEVAGVLQVGTLVEMTLEAA